MSTGYVLAMRSVGTVGGLLPVQLRRGCRRGNGPLSLVLLLVVVTLATQLRQLVPAASLAAAPVLLLCGSSCRAHHVLAACRATPGRWGGIRINHLADECGREVPGRRARGCCCACFVARDARGPGVRKRAVRELKVATLARRTRVLCAIRRAGGRPCVQRSGEDVTWAVAVRSVLTVHTNGAAMVQGPKAGLLFLLL
jgi:hypothetical protein